jgi:hypothetical protein
VGEALGKYLEQLPGQQQSRTRALLAPGDRVLAYARIPIRRRRGPEPPVIPDCGTGRVKEVTMTRRIRLGIAAVLTAAGLMVGLAVAAHAGVGQAHPSVALYPTAVEYAVML